MRKTMKLLLTLVVLANGLTATSLAATKYIITNDDNPSGNSVTIYSAAADGSLTLVKTIPTGGYGIGGGYVGTPRLSTLRSKANNCAYVADVYNKKAALPSDIAAIDMSTLTLAGTFPGYPLDSGANWGISLAENPTGTFLFAAFPQSGTITTYKQRPGCQLTRLSQIITFGANGRPVGAMKVTPNGRFLIVSYDDGTLGSYKIDSDTGALTLINRYWQADIHAPHGAVAASVEITSDSRWVLFGDVVSLGIPTVDVAHIGEDGSLGATQDYAGIGTGLGSTNIWLSPDETVLYISNTVSGQITAVPFSKEFGVIDISKACTSPQLKKFYLWQYVGSIVGTSDSDTGSPLYAAEYGYGSLPPNRSNVATVAFSKPCTLREIPRSPATDPASSYLLSIEVDPPRTF